jgi:CRP-like cAMP-binding protein
MLPPTDPRANRLLAALPDTAWQRWQAQLEAVPLPLGKVLHEPGGRLGHLYFPTSATVSLLCVLENGASAEAGVVGPEGLVGVALVLGGGTTTHRAVVQSAGLGFRLPAATAQAELEHGGPAVPLLLRGAQVLVTQASQAAVCNRHHALEQQLCRWLLAAQDRQPAGDLVVTHELVGIRLGVRREGVTAAARGLQAAGLIRGARGRITVLDRAGLEARSCECYRIVRAEQDRLLPAPTATPH